MTSSLFFETYNERRNKKWKEKSTEEQKMKIKKHKKLYRKKYIQKNIENIKNYQKSLREIDREIGNCTSCHKPKDNPKYTKCSKCREYYRNYYKRK